MIQIYRTRVAAKFGELEDAKKELDKIDKEGTEIAKVNKFDSRLCILRDKRLDAALKVEKIERMNAIIKHFDSEDNLLASLNPDFMLNRYLDTKTAADVIKQKKITLSELSVIYENNIGTSFLIPYVSKLMRINSTIVPDDTTIKLFAKALHEECFFLSVAEIAFVFGRIIRGHYGSLYNKCTPDAICQMFVTYRKERMVALDQIEKERNPPTSMAGNIQKLANSFDQLPADSVIRRYAELGRSKEARKVFRQQIQEPEESDEAKEIRAKMKNCLQIMAVSAPDVAAAIEVEYNKLAEQLK